MWKIIALTLSCLSIGAVYSIAYLIGSTQNTELVVVYFLLLGINVICISILFILLFIKLIKDSNRLNTFALIISMLFVSVLLYGELWEYTREEKISQIFERASWYFPGHYQVYGASMEPNLKINEFVYGQTIKRPLRNGDIVFINSSIDQSHEGAEVLYIKRIIASPGQNIRISRGEIYIDGTVITEPYQTQGDIYSGLFKQVSTNNGYTLKENEYFVIGDNRQHSNDSRDFGPISRNDIKLVLVFKDELEAEIQKVNW